FLKCCNAKRSETLRNALFLAGLLLAGRALLRAYPFLPAAAWAAVALICRRGLPVYPVQERPSLRARAATAGLLVLSLGVSVFIVEAGVRLFVEPSYGNAALFEPHPEYIYMLKPGGGGVRDLPVGPEETRPVSFEISPQGLRDRVYGPKKPDEFRILMLGDSFTMGWSCSLDESIPRYLERLLNQAGLNKKVTVVNAGVAGYGPWQERGFLAERGFALEPDLVLLQLFPGNDIDNTLLREGRYLQAYDTLMHNDIETHRYKNLWQARVTRWIFDHFRSVYFLHKNTGLNLRFYDWWNAIRFLPRCAMPEPPENVPRPFWLETDLEQWYPELQDGFGKMLLDVQGIHEDCRKRNVDFLAFCVPGEEVVNGVLWQENMGALPPEPKYDRGKSIRLTELGMTMTGVPFFSITGRLSACLDIESLYYRYDGHFSEAGNERVAQFIRDQLVEGYFPTRFGAPASKPSP
ncbi:MAG: hypothetical protein QG656_2098, partial [Candidatus Hydrogenedentes bacterium]|nr:hypothetical protein [Candidatus Hydrogenedentota bacterium]